MGSSSDPCADSTPVGVFLLPDDSLLAGVDIDPHVAAKLPEALSPNWEGPYRINRSAPGNAYILETLEGVEFLRALNGKYLKRYYPSIWLDA